MDYEILRQAMEKYIPFNAFLQMRVAEVRKGFARIEIPFRPELIGDPTKPALHGGVISALADATGGAAVWTGVDDVRVRVSTIDIRVDYLLPGRLETLVAEASVVRLGGRIGVADIKVFHESTRDESVAVSKAVYYVRMPKTPMAESGTGSEP